MQQIIVHVVFMGMGVAKLAPGVQHRFVAMSAICPQTGPMSRDTIDQICATFAGATASDPATELDSWKVGGKMFACFGNRLDGVAVKTVSVETAQMLIDAGAATKAPYFHRSWVLVSFTAPEDELHHRIAASYKTIFAGRSKKQKSAISTG